jgi:tRNA (Thr-GGU) A37 N-methylase
MFAIEPIGFVRGGRVEAIDDTPLVDLKPCMSGFLPRGPVRQPEWAVELMRDDWQV